MAVLAASGSLVVRPSHWMCPCGCGSSWVVAMSLPATLLAAAGAVPKLSATEIGLSGPSGSD